MTQQKSFKRLVRARVDETGESYAAARKALLGDESAGSKKSRGKGVLATSDAGIRERTGRGWEEWFDLLDEWGAADKTHREIARELGRRLDLNPLAWNVQAIVGSYEKVRGGKEVGEKEDGFSVNASRTIAASPTRVYKAFAEAGERKRWLDGADLTYRSGTKPKTAHLDAPDGTSRVHVTIAADGDRAKVSVEHARLADAPAAEKAKSFWRERLTALKKTLERADG